MRHRQREERVVRLDGVFDVPAARRVERLLEQAQPGAAVRLDLTHVREFHDFGVAVLAQALKHGSAVRVALQGLRQHQARLLRYFGVDAARFEAYPGGVAADAGSETPKSILEDLAQVRSLVPDRVLHRPARPVGLRQVDAAAVPEPPCGPDLRPDHRGERGIAPAGPCAPRIPHRGAGS